MKALDELDSPSGRRLDDTSNKTGEAFTALSDLIDDENLKKSINNLNDDEKIELLAKIKKSIETENIQDHINKKDAVGKIAFAFMLISVLGRIAMDVSSASGYKPNPILNHIARSIFNLFDEASIVCSYSADDLNMLSPVIALAIQIVISAARAEKTDAKYKKAFLATVGPVIPLLLIDYFLNNFDNNSVSSYLVSNGLTLATELARIRIGETPTEAAAAVEAAAVEAAAVEEAAVEAAAVEEAAVEAAAVEQTEKEEAALLSASKKLVENIVWGDNKSSVANYYPEPLSLCLLKNLNNAVNTENLPTDVKGTLENIINILNEDSLNNYEDSIENNFDKTEIGQLIKNLSNYQSFQQNSPHLIKAISKLIPFKESTKLGIATPFYGGVISLVDEQQAAAAAALLSASKNLVEDITNSSPESLRDRLLNNLNTAVNTGNLQENVKEKLESIVPLLNTDDYYNKKQDIISLINTVSDMPIHSNGNSELFPIEINSFKMNMSCFIEAIRTLEESPPIVANERDNLKPTKPSKGWFEAP
ncbi:hypothetical protein N8762_00060 [Candidatus Marinamargulisbacteria bacterium]|nr:hypothetical protein [Candidatus Marinamargulisbacteria bacterium]